jgi:glycosyltransferase involved in cell wall biosynthesis
MENTEMKWREHKKVSIIVPIYNAEKYIGYCINSIVSQTYQNIEIILVNDGSTDASLEICNNYATNDNRIKVIDIPNGGVSNARNIGLQEASGEYIQFVDADDTIAQCMTEKMCELVENYNKDLAICGFDMITLDSNNNVAEKIPFHCETIGYECVLEKKEFHDKLCRILFRTSLLEEPVNKIYKCKIIKDNNIKFNENITLGEDFLFNMEYFKYVNGCVFTKERYYKYMQFNKNSLSNRYREDLFYNHMYLIDEFQKLVGNYTLIEEEERVDLASYMVSKIIKSIENLFVEQCHLNKVKKKGKIAEMINYPNVKMAFKEASYLKEEYKDIREYIEYSDVGRIYEKMKGNI